MSNASKPSERATRAIRKLFDAAREIVDAEREFREAAERDGHRRNTAKRTRPRKGASDAD